MITINKSIEIVDGQAPYTVIVNTEGNQTVVQQSTNVYRITLTYESEDQITGTESVTVIDSKGCIRSISLSVTNICDEFYVSSITNTSTEGLTKYYTITSDQNINIEWSLDNPEYYTTEINGNTIGLTQILSGIQQTNLRAIVTNDNNCTEEKRISLFPARVLAQPSTINLNLQENGKYTATVSLRGSTSFPSSTINWSSLTLTNNTSLQLTQRPGQPQVDIVSQTPIDAEFFFTVADSNGLRSNRARVTVTSAEVQTVPEITTDFGTEPVVLGIGYMENILSIQTNNLFPPSISVTGINTSLTTANSATFSNNIISANVTGQQVATIGVDLISSTGAMVNPSVIAIIRQFAQFSPADVEREIACSSITYDVLTQLGHTPLKIVSGNATLSGSILTIPEGEQAVIVQVRNTDSQTSNLRINVCGECGEDVEQTICEANVNLYSFFNNPNPNGTWTAITPGAPVPTTYNGDVTLSTTGLIAYVYNSPNSVGEYSCANTTNYVLELTRVAASNISNNVCANPKSLPTVNDTQTVISGENISSNCFLQTTWSGNAGNLTDKLYDQWFTYETVSTVALTLKTTISVTGSGNTPLSIPSIQLWDNCSTLTTGVTYTQTLNKATAVYQTSSGQVLDKLIQVLSDSEGQYIIEIKQELI